MSPLRVHTAELTKLLNSAKQPIYVLDDELTIVFLNRAAQEWLDTEQSLVGRKCTYRSDPSVEGLDGVAAGLCPPPGVLSGETAVATVSRTAEDGRLIERRARFLPISVGADDLLGVLAVLETVDRSPGDVEQDVETEEAVPHVLHEQVRRFRQEAAARYRADRLIGQGPAMRLARRQVELAAAGHGSVLMVGPTGSGRRHVAAAIHYGATSAETLVPLDCSLLGVDLLEEVLTAMARSRHTPCAVADGTRSVPTTGTLLFHRIDELSPDMQVELTGLLTRRPHCWRLMATATEPLLELGRRGQFRTDLAAALSTIVIELPSLAERRDDLPLLAQLFLEELNAGGPRQMGGFTPAALDLLDGYGWPGNLDELAEAVAEAHQHAPGVEVDVADLPERLRVVDRAAARPRPSEETIVLDEYLGRVERELIRRALARAKGNKAQAARLLGTTRARLYRRMQQLELQ